MVMCACAAKSQSTALCAPAAIYSSSTASSLGAAHGGPLRIGWPTTSRCLVAGGQRWREWERPPAPKRPVASQGASPHPMHFERLQLAVRVHVLLQSNQILVTLVQTTSVCGAPMQWRRSSYEYGPDTRGPDTRGPDTRGPDTRNSTDAIAKGLWSYEYLVLPLHRRAARDGLSRGFSSCHMGSTVLYFMVHHRSCGALTEIQIAIWSPDETQYTAQSSVRSWQTLHIQIDLIKLYYRLRARRARSGIYLYLYLCVLRADRTHQTYDGRMQRSASTQLLGAVGDRALA